MTPAGMRCSGATSIWIAAIIILRERVGELFRCWSNVLATEDAEDIHDLRVASRRLREGLALFVPCYPKGRMGTIGKRLKKLTRLLGDIRNLDEANVFFRGLADEVDNPGCRRELLEFIDSMAARRSAEMRRLLSELQSADRKGLRNRYLRVINGLPLFSPPASGVDLLAPLSGFAAMAFDDRFKAVGELLAPAAEDGAIEAQHRLRIAIKHLRYRMEQLAFLFGSSYPQLHDLVKRYQDVLGVMNDLDVFGSLVREWGFSADTERELQELVAAKRVERFGVFRDLLAGVPLEQLGERLEELRDV